MQAILVFDLELTNQFEKVNTFMDFTESYWLPQGLMTK